MEQQDMKKLLLRFCVLIMSSTIPTHQCSAQLMIFMHRQAVVLLYICCFRQGIISGINAARHSDGKPLIILERESSYIGTLIDDLITKDLREPYRMLTR